MVIMTVTMIQSVTARTGSLSWLFSMDSPHDVITTSIDVTGTRN